MAALLLGVCHSPVRVQDGDHDHGCRSQDHGCSEQDTPGHHAAGGHERRTGGGDADGGGRQDPACHRQGARRGPGRGRIRIRSQTVALTPKRGAGVFGPLQPLLSLCRGLVGVAQARLPVAHRVACGQRHVQPGEMLGAPTRAKVL